MKYSLDLGPFSDELGRELEAAVLARGPRAAFIGGEEVAAFERAFADCLGAETVIGVGNGTDAIELSLRALNSAGDEALVPANTFIATAELWSRPAPVRASSTSTPERPDRPRELRRAPEDRTKAVIPGPPVRPDGRHGGRRCSSPPHGLA